MLGKLLKHEIKATSRLFLPMFASVILVALINKVVSSPFEQNGLSFSLVIRGSDLMSLIQLFSVLTFILLLLVAIGMSFFVMIQRFYKNLLRDEGYLMFTLPVQP